LLSAQIGYIALLLPLSLLGILLGYQIAYSGGDRIDCGDKAIGICLLLAGLSLALVCAGLLPGLGYWLAFEGGLNSLLS
jgi:hypothetical protein